MSEFERLHDAHGRMLGRHDAARLEYRRARLAKNDADMDRWCRVMDRRIRAAMRLTNAMSRAAI